MTNTQRDDELIERMWLLLHTRPRLTTRECLREILAVVREHDGRDASSMSVHNGVPICPHGIHPTYCRICFGPPMVDADAVKVQAWDVSSRLRRELNEARAELAALRALADFGRWCLTEVRQPAPGDIDGGAAQDEAIRLGLLKYVAVTEPCDEVCACMDYYAHDEWPHQCLRETDAAIARGKE